MRSSSATESATRWRSRSRWRSAVDGAPLAVTMRTPGHDEELAAGFLFGEGLLDGPPYFRADPELAANRVDVTGPLRRDPGTRRFYTTSSCGVCGKGALEEVAVAAPPAPAGPVVARELLAALPGRLRQPEFVRTGGLHATGLFNADGELAIVREDVGRHNAMDKVVGRALLDGLVPLAEHLLCVSGRLSFELVQKAAVAGAPCWSASARRRRWRSRWPPTAASPWPASRARDG